MSKFRSIVLLSAMSALIAPPATRADAAPAAAENPAAVPAVHAEDPPAPVASSRTQATDRVPPAKVGAPKSGTPAEVVAPEVAVQPTTAEATLQSETSGEPSPERRAVLKKVAKLRQARAARRLALLRYRQAAYAQRMIWLAQQGSSGGTRESSSDSPSCPSQDSTRRCPTSSYPVSVYTPSQPGPTSVQSRSLTGEILDAHRKMSQRYP